MNPVRDKGQEIRDEQDESRQGFSIGRKRMSSDQHEVLSPISLLALVSYYELACDFCCAIC
jgi:hypothetical protein